MTQQARCLLCGARLTAPEILDACAVIVSPELPALGARCPHCQGYFEVRPTEHGIDVGYCNSDKAGDFQVVCTLEIEGFKQERMALPAKLLLSSSQRRWEFANGEMD